MTTLMPRAVRIDHRLIHSLFRSAIISRDDDDDGVNLAKACITAVDAAPILLMIVGWVHGTVCAL
eukprot:6278387-Pyramimonas_sp.AAC.1